MSKSQEILVLVDGLNNRIHFLFRHVFTKMMGIRPTFTNDKEAFSLCTTAKLNYSSERISDELYIRPHGLLYQKGIKRITFKTGKNSGVPIIFMAEGDSDYIFDIFSAIFYMLTRYEEYLPYSPDKHGRFQPHESIASELKFIEEPIVEIWVELFKDFLKTKFSHFEYSTHKYHYIPTVDVDMAYAYKHKGVFLSTGLLVRDLFTLRLKDLFKRVGSLTRVMRDPYDTFEYLEKVFREKGKMPIFFYLSGKRGKFDKNNSMRSNAMKKIVKQTSSFAEVGLHPSYASNKKLSLLEAEKATIEAALGHSVRKTRQHFIKCSFPGTFLGLIKAGFNEDYSMGYAQTCGFRAGTCTPYNFYDIVRDKESELRIIPFMAMDATFKTYLKYTPQQALEKMIELREKARLFGGVFSVVWHNDTFASTPEGMQWRSVFEQMLD